jgi:hypothetical protein
VSSHLYYNIRNVVISVDLSTTDNEMAATYAQRLRQNLSLLKRTIDPSYELIGSLQLEPVLETVFDFAALNSKTTPNDIITHLLVSLRKQPENVFEAFISLLNENDQEHAAALISGKQSTTNRVHMSDEHFQTLCDKSFELRRFMNPFGGLLDHLMSTDTFQRRDKERVQSKRTVRYHG